MYLCFIDYTKTNDNVKHEKIIKLIEQINTNGIALPTIKNI